MLTLKTWEIDSNIDNLWSSFIKRKCDINELNILKNSTLLESEYLSVLARNYIINTHELLASLDTHLKTTYPPKFTFGIIFTDTKEDWQIIPYGEGDHRAVLGFFIYTTTPSICDASKNGKGYSLSEIKEMVKNGEIILLTKTYTKNKSQSSHVITPSEAEAYDSLTLDSMGLEEMDVYSEYILPIIRKEMSEERLAADILTIIASARTEARTMLTNFQSLESHPDLLKPELLKRVKKETSSFLSYLSEINL